MVPRCPARYPDTPCHCRSYLGAQWVIWHPCGMPPRRGQKTLQLGTWQPHSLAESLLSSVVIVLRPTRTAYKFLILSVRARALWNLSSRTILKSAHSWRAVVFRGAPVDFLDSRLPVAACFRRMRLTIFPATLISISLYVIWLIQP